MMVYLKICQNYYSALLTVVNQILLFVGCFNVMVSCNMVIM